jgi:hypothetical protein
MEKEATMDANSELSVTLSSTLLKRLKNESNRLNEPLEWVIAAFLLDHFGELFPSNAV